jgi:hypothetical protein
MALTYTELQSITNDYFLMDNKAATNIYFSTSYLLDLFMNKKKGLFERPAGGERIRVPLMYDGAEGGFYARTDTLSSDDRANINAARFQWKHAYGNATIYRTDELSNASEYAEVQMVTQKIQSAQATVTKYLAQQLYSAAGDSAVELSGLYAMCFGGTSTAYGDITPTDLVSSLPDAYASVYPWASVNTTTATGISLAVVRTLASTAKVNDGAMGKPDVGVLTEALFNIIAGILQTQQRFTQDVDTAKAGFTHVVFEGKTIAADDYGTSGCLFLLNSNYCGFAIHRDGFFARTPWGDLVITGTVARSMKIFWDGNFICSRRRAHAGQSSLT